MLAPKPVSLGGACGSSGDEKESRKRSLLFCVKCFSTLKCESECTI